MIIDNKSTNEPLVLIECRASSWNEDTFYFPSCNENYMLVHWNISSTNFNIHCIPKADYKAGFEDY